MSKLTKFLLKNGTLIADCTTGSSYYKIADQKVRVSNHLPGSKNLSDLIIFTPINSKKCYMVSILGMIHVYNSYTSLRVFLEHWIMLANLTYANKNFEGSHQESIQASMTRLHEQLKARSKHLAQVEDSCIKLKQKLEAANKLMAEKEKEVKEKVTPTTLGNFTPGQMNAINAFIKQNSKSKKTKLKTNGI